MKKSILLVMVVCMLVTGLLMACSSTASPTPQPTTQVAIPLVSGGTEATLPAEAKSYTLEELKAMSDDQVRTFLNKKLMGHHTIDWVLRKNLTAEQWKSVLGKSEHSDVNMTDVERDFLIEWIIKNHQD
ncbi:MAG: hypothetical protein WBI14_07680 [Anaerolineaceae bacterium]